MSLFVHFLGPVFGPPKSHTRTRFMRKRVCFWTPFRGFSPLLGVPQFSRKSVFFGFSVPEGSRIAIDTTFGLIGGSQKGRKRVKKIVPFWHFRCFRLVSSRTAQKRSIRSLRIGVSGVFNWIPEATVDSGKVVLEPPKRSFLTSRLAFLSKSAIWDLWELPKMTKIPSLSHFWPRVKYRVPKGPKPCTWRVFRLFDHFGTTL